MTQQEAWELWPEHKGHDLGSQPNGDVQCRTCGYVTLKRQGVPPRPESNEILYPFWK